MLKTSPISQAYSDIRQLVARIANGMVSDKRYSMADLMKTLMGDAQWADRQAMVDHVQQLMDYYSGYQTEYLVNALSEKYVDKHPLLLEKTTYNVVRRGIKTVSNIYDAQPERKLVTPEGKELDGNDPQYKALAWLLNELQYDSVLQKVNQYVNLVGTCVVRPAYIPRHGRWIMDTFTYKDLHVVPTPELPSEAEAIAYCINPHEISMPDTDASKSSQEVLHWWTKDSFAVVEGSEGFILSTDTNRESVNPYGVLPFVKFTAETTGAHYFATPGKELIHIQDDINIALTNWNYVLKMQGFSIPVVIGNIANKDNKVSISPGKPLTIRSGMKDEQAPSFNWATPSPNLEGYKNYVSYRLEQLAYYLFTNRNQLTGTSQPASGYSLKLQNWELMNQRNKQVALYEYNEQRLFKVLKVMWNAHQQAGDLPQDCPYRNVRFKDNIQLQVNIPSIEYPESPQETLARWTQLIERKMKTPVDFLTEVQGLEKSEAEKQFKTTQDWFSQNGEKFEPSKFGEMPKNAEKAEEMPDKLTDKQEEEYVEQT